jgi:hypothetical protein
MLVKGDYWTWDEATGKLQQRTHWGYNHEPVLSPDGTHIAYLSDPQLTIDARQHGCCGGGTLPGNIWVLKITNNVGTRLANQPANAHLDKKGVPKNGIVRGTPAWSPDSSKLAWVEYSDINTGNPQSIVVYGFAQQRAKTIVKALPDMAGVPAPADIRWGTSGIIVRSVTAQPGGSDLTNTLLIYDDQGRLVNTLADIDSPDQIMLDYLIVTFAGYEYFDVLYNTRKWVLFDPQTGNSQPAPNPPELYSPAHPETSYYGIPAKDCAGNMRTWQLHTSTGSVLGPPAPIGCDLRYSLALPPSGHEFAFVLVGPTSKSAVSVWSGSKSVAVSLADQSQSVGALVWGYTAWRIR